MLAERKKKVKWTLNPRGNSWSKDANKFGQRMLEKMGWKSGEGLGVNKQGIKEHIKVAYKNDNKCLGYKDSGEEWVEHQSQFESLLADLSTSHSTVVAALDSDKDKIPQTETLEQRSRHSRTRVHYQKFTRGKDLSRYDEKDLKCILLGKQKANNAAEESKDCDGNNDHFNGFYGIKTINSGNMNDYFKKRKLSQNYSDIYNSDVLLGEEEVSEKNNDEKQCDVKVNKKKKRKPEMQLCDTETNNMDFNETLSIQQHEKKQKKKNCEVPELSDSANDDHSYTDFENQSVPDMKLKRYNVTDCEDTVTNYMCNEELYCNEICKEKRPKKLKNGNTQDRECEVMEVDDDIEDMQAKKKYKKKNFELLNESKESSAKKVSRESENSKDDVEHLTLEVDDNIDAAQVKKKSRKKNPMLSSKEETSLELLKCVSHEPKNAEDFGFHLIQEVEGKQKKKKSKKKTRELTGESGGTSALPAEDVSHSLENLKDTKEYCLAVEIANEVEGKQLKKKSEKKNHVLLSECEEISLVPGDDISQMSEHLENTVEHFMGKNKEKLTTGTRGIHISLENDLVAADINSTCSDNEGRSKSRQTTEDVMPTKRKKKKNAKNSIAEDISKHINVISVEKKKHKRNKDEDESEIGGHSEQTELMKEDKNTNADEELQNVVNSISGCSQTIVNENMAQKLSKSCTKSHERYSVDELKNMKSALFAQLVDPRLIEFKGSNLHKIAGYGKC